MSAVYPSQLDRDKHAATFPGKTCLNRRKNHGCGQEKTEDNGSLYLVSGPLPNAANSREVPTEFAGVVQLSVPYAVPMISAVRIKWLRFFFCYSYGAQLFGLQSVSASLHDTTKMKSSKANFVTSTFCLPPKRTLSILLNFLFPCTVIRYLSRD